MTQLTLEFVLHKFYEDPKISENQKSMTRTSIKYVLLANNVSLPFEICITKIHKSKTRLKWYLIKEKPDLSSNTKRNYVSFFQRLIAWGVNKGYIPKKIENNLSKEWAKACPLIPDATPRLKGLRSGLRKLGFWASSLVYSPYQITRQILNDFIFYLENESNLKHWRITYTGAQKDWHRQSMEGILPTLENWPALPTMARSVYCLQLKEWPKLMQDIYYEYRAWCTKLFVTGRNKRYKQKSVSADKNRQLLEQITGFAHRIMLIPKEELTFDIFFNPDIITSYLNWMVTKRLNNKQTPSLQRLIAVLLGMARGYFQNKEAETWLQPLLDNMDCVYVKNKKECIVSEEEIQKTADGIKKRRLNILYDSFKKKRSPSAKTIARLVRDELIIRFLGARPLRSKNLRELQLKKNLFFNNDGILWLEFSKSETKAKNIITFPYPEDLEDLLWVYLEIYRPILLDGHDTDWVFPSPNGTHILSATVLQIVSKHFKKFTGKHVYPHILRHSAVYNYLIKNPGDFLTVQKILGHIDIKTTIKIYSNYEGVDAAKRFDEFRLEQQHKNESEKGNTDE